MKVAVFVKATQGSEAGVLPGEQLLADMGKYNEALVNAGIMKTGEGKWKVAHEHWSIPFNPMTSQAWFIRDPNTIDTPDYGELGGQ